MTTLCRHSGFWYIAEALGPTRCALRCGANMPGEPEFVLAHTSTYRSRAVEIDDSYTFYPHLRYMGAPVYPWAWHKTSVEPILRVRMEALRAFPGESDEAVKRRIRQVVLKGWEEDRDAATGYVHVDELEKVEGPMPFTPDD